jgi:glycosyltransferase involved in cell wall biosynthesis
MSEQKIRLAYLNTEYPSLSHTFIEREVRSVRGTGIEVHTCSVRRPGRSGTLGVAHAAAAAETFYLLDGALPLLLDQVWGKLRHPLRYLRTLFAAQRIAPPGLRSRFLHAVYGMEGVRLVRELRRRGLTHVHVDMANNGAMVARLATIFDPRLTYSLTVHGPSEFFNVEKNRLTEKVEGALFTRCISNFCRGQVMTWVDPGVWDRLHIVHCGVDPNVFTPRPGRAAGPFRLLTVGRLAPVKGYEITLQACRLLTARGVDWHLDMIGDGPSRERLQRMAADLGIAGQVTFHGAAGQDEILAHFDRADALVVSSFLEGVPVVLMEAMAKELAVIATRVAGIGELVEDGVSGLLVDASSVEDLAAAMERLANERDRLREYGKAGRQRVLAEFAHPGVGERMAGLFRRYLGGEP